MGAGSFATLIVLDRRKQIAGVLRWRDLLKSLVAEGSDPHALRVEDVMTETTLKVRMGTSLLDALVLMRHRHLSCLPVVENDGQVLGAVLLQDVLAEVVEDIKRHPQPEAEALLAAG